MRPAPDKPKTHTWPKKVGSAPRTHPLEKGSKVLKIPIVLVPQVVRVLAVPDVLLGVDVEALRVPGVADGREDGAPVAAVVDGVPVDAAEEGVLLDAPRAALDVAEALGPVDVAEGPYDVLGLGGDGGFLWEDDGFLDDPRRGDGMSVYMLERP